MSVELNAPKTLNLEADQGSTLTEAEAYALAKKINEEDKDHEAKVEDGQLKVHQVLKG
jgi:hypothetical protein